MFAPIMRRFERDGADRTRAFRSARKNLGEEPMAFENPKNLNVSRRSLLQTAAAMAGGVVLPSGLVMPAFAVDASKPAIGTWPAGSEGSTVNIGAAVPRTGAYAVQGEDELK